jgi:peroxin-5
LLKLLLTYKLEEWAEEFEKHAQEAWADEFDNFGMKGDVVNSSNELYDTLSSIGDQKLMQSEFMSFIRQLKDEEIVIQGNKILPGSEKTAGIRVDQFETFQASSSGPVPELSRAELQNFEQTYNEPAETADARKQQIEQFVEEFSQRFDPMSGTIWTDEEAFKLERQWAESVNVYNSEGNEEQRFVPGDPMERWVEQYRRNIVHLSQERHDVDWTAAPKSWTQGASGFGYRLSDAMYDTYQFERINPYTTNAPKDLSYPSATQNVTDAILRLEALVQMNASDSRAWLMLGECQQENENEVAAIAALRQATLLNPDYLNAWLLLAVSYTNENSKEDAFDAIESWLRHHPNYQNQFSQAAFQHPNRHSYLTALFLDIARTNPGEKLDPDVQNILGIMFNNSEEYHKAVDCFSAALVKKPNVSIGIIICSVLTPFFRIINCGIAWALPLLTFRSLPKPWTPTMLLCN